MSVVDRSSRLLAWQKKVKKRREGKKRGSSKRGWKRHSWDLRFLYDGCADYCPSLFIVVSSLVTGSNCAKFKLRRPRDNVRKLKCCRPALMPKVMPLTRLVLFATNLDVEFEMSGKCEQEKAENTYFFPSLQVFQRTDYLKLTQHKPST